MTEPTNEQIERAAKDAGWGDVPSDSLRKNAAMGHPTARSILAHARTITEAEAREARLREALGKISEPLAYLKRLADEQEANLNGCAVSIAKDPDFLRSIARTALEDQHG